MDTNPLFTLALGLSAPWRVVETRFDEEQKRLDLRLAYATGAHFACPGCAAANCPVYDAEEKQWRHLDFFQHQAYLTARVPRVRCDQCGVRQVAVPWARPGSGFTLLMEALVLELARNMPMRAIARLLAVGDKRLWRVVSHYVKQALAKSDCRRVRRVGIDETSARKRHDYISLFFDLDARRLVFATPGRDAATVGRFGDFLRDHRGAETSVREVSCDMSPAFISGVRQHLPRAAITLDRFHVTRVLTDAVDAVRRSEWRSDKAVKGSRYLLLTNPESLTREQETRLAEVMARNVPLAEAYRLKETFRDLYRQPDYAAGRGFLKAWITMAYRSSLAPMIRAANTIRRHWQGILHWHVSKVTNGVMEALASLVQAAKRKARGYRNHETFVLMAYLIAGKLDLESTHTK
jgi:transposase